MARFFLQASLARGSRRNFRARSQPEGVIKYLSSLVVKMPKQCDDPLSFRYQGTFVEL